MYFLFPMNTGSFEQIVQCETVIYCCYHDIDMYGSSHIMDYNFPLNNIVVIINLWTSCSV